MKILITIIITSLLFAESFIYVGQDNEGKLMAGANNKIYPNYPQTAFYIESDVRTEGIELNSKGYKPNTVIYSIKAFYHGVYYKHTCGHGINAVYYDVKDVIGIEIGG